MVHLLEVEHVRLVVLAVPGLNSIRRTRKGTGVRTAPRWIDGMVMTERKVGVAMECPPGSGRLRRGANLRMRDFHSSICFLCVSGVGWILCGGVGSSEGEGGVGGWRRHGERRDGIDRGWLARFLEGGRARATGR